MHAHDVVGFVLRVTVAVSKTWLTVIGGQMIGLAVVLGDDPTIVTTSEVRSLLQMMLRIDLAASIGLVGLVLATGRALPLLPSWMAPLLPTRASAES